MSMGQRINPYGFRLRIPTDHKPLVGTNKLYSYISKDVKIRRLLSRHLLGGDRRTRDRVRVDIYTTARPGIVIERDGAEAERIRSDLENLTGCGPAEHSRSQEPGNRCPAGGSGRSRATGVPSGPPALCARHSKVHGIRIQCSGRLGAEMSHSESIARVRCHCTRCGPTSTTASTRPRRRWGQRGQGLQGQYFRHARGHQKAARNAAGGRRPVPGAPGRRRIGERGARRCA